jgi:ribosome biogenesis GTPase A
MSEPIDIQWFPGHMAKTERMISASLKLVDCVAEILDARVPQSSRNPELGRLCGQKPRLIVLNKADLADENETAAWAKRFRSRGLSVIVTDCKTGRGVKSFEPAVRSLLKERIARDRAKGMTGRSLRVLVAGIPNCGKSTFINKIAGGRLARAENRPGVTKGRQWITVGAIELLDTPGVLWPKFDDKETGEKLACIGSVRDEILDTELLASRLLERLAALYPDKLCARFKLGDALPEDGFEILKLIAAKRGLIAAGASQDTLRAASVVLEEFRSAKIGRFTLDKCPE